MLFLCIGLIALVAILAPTGFRWGASGAEWFTTVAACIGDAVTGQRRKADYAAWARDQFAVQPRSVITFQFPAFIAARAAEEK